MGDVKRDRRWRQILWFGRAAGFDRGAGGVILLRGLTVGVNFAVMLWLAAALGLAGFGRLALLWGVALVLAPLLSLGGPLVLLRQLTDGSRLPLARIAGLALFGPALLAVILGGPLSLFWPGGHWPVILLLALGINLLACVASVARALGAVSGSMGLRDAGPHLALFAGWALLPGAAPELILWAAAGMMLALGGAVGLACLWQLRRRQGDDPAPADWRMLWLSAVLGSGVSQMDIVTGALVISPEALGLYAVLRRIANLVALPVSVATWVSAAPISAAFAKGQRQALQTATAMGSRIAFGAGALLFVIGLLSLPLIAVLAPEGAGQMAMVVVALSLGGAFGQVWFAAAFPLATLCGYGAEAAIARAVMALSYLGGIAVVSGLGGGPLAAGPMLNAGIYAVALTAGSLFLWWRLLQLSGVNSAATVLWRAPDRRPAWTLS